MRATKIISGVLALTSVSQAQVPSAQNDTLGLKNGYLTFDTSTFIVQLVKYSQTLASLIPHSNPEFDFQPNKTLLALRAADGKYQTGDLINTLS
jgi:hypothetical protein